MKGEQLDAYNFLLEEASKVKEGYWGEDDDFDDSEFAEDLIEFLEDE